MHAQGNFKLLPHVKAITPRDAASMRGDDAYEAFKAIRWGWRDGRPDCKCGGERLYEYTARSIFKCAKCGRQFSATSGTTFNARKLPFTTIISALAITLHDATNARQLGIRAGVTYKTSTTLLKSFRLFSGNVAVQTRDKCWPYLSREPNDADALIMRVSAAVPKTMPEQVRADVCQDLILGVLAGDFTEADLTAQVSRYIRQHYKTVEFNRFRDFSFDQPVPGTDGLRWDEVVAAPPEYEEAESMDINGH